MLHNEIEEKCDIDLDLFVCCVWDFSGDFDMSVKDQSKGCIVTKQTSVCLKQEKFKCVFVSSTFF